MKKKIIIFGILSVIYILGFPLLKHHVIDAKYKITIQTTNEKNKSSKGTEVWINSIKKDEKLVDLTTVILEDNWENRGRLYNPGNVEGEWSFVIKSKDKTTITFITHPYSGIVSITDGRGNSTELDLYSEEQNELEFVIEP